METVFKLAGRLVVMLAVCANGRILRRRRRNRKRRRSRREIARN